MAMVSNEKEKDVNNIIQKSIIFLSRSRLIAAKNNHFISKSILFQSFCCNII